MTTWVEGRTYDYYGAPLTCVRRYFEGTLELVDLAFPIAAVAVAEGCSQHFTRTARTLAPCVKPEVTETLGGVLRADACAHHESFARVTANAGPNAGKLCCSACGGEVPHG